MPLEICFRPGGDLHQNKPLGVGVMPITGGFLRADGPIRQHHDWQVGMEGALRNHRTLLTELNARNLVEMEADDHALIAAILSEIGFARSLGRLEGDFLVAAWNAQEAALYVARDRAGVYPLYYWQEGENWHIASIPPRSDVSKANLQSLHAMGVLLPPHTPFQKIQKLPAGYFLKIDAQGLHLQSWWEITPYQAGYGGAAHRWARSVEFGLELAVRQQVEGPAAVLYSGGLFSGALLGMAAARAPERLLAITVDLGESERAQAGARACKVDWLKVPIHAEDAETILQTLATLPLPLLSPGIPAWWLGAQAAARQGFKRVVGGFGAAQIFAQDRPHRLAALSRWLPPPVLGQLSKIAPRKRAEVLAIYQRPPEEWLCAWRWRGPQSPQHNLQALANTCPSRDPLAMMLWLEQKVFLPEALLQALDQIGRAFGIQIGAPLCDPALAAMVAQIPLGLLRLGPRGLFGRATARHFSTLPERHPMTVPMADWLRGPLAHRLNHLPEQLEDWLDPQMLRQQIADHQGGLDRSQGVWAALVLATWRAAG